MSRVTPRSVGCACTARGRATTSPATPVTSNRNAKRAVPSRSNSKDKSLLAFLGYPFLVHLGLEKIHLTLKFY